MAWLLKVLVWWRSRIEKKHHALHDRLIGLDDWIKEVKEIVE